MYSAITDLEKLLEPNALRQLADDGPDAATPEAVMEEAIDQADREIDAILNAVAEVPFNPVPPLVANLSAKIAVYNLHRRRSHLEVGEWGKEYDRCRQLLKSIAKGEMTLGAKEEGETSAPENPGRPVMQTRPREFPDKRLERY